MCIKYEMSKQEAELVSNSEWFSAEIANIRKKYIFYLSLKKLWR